LAPQAIAETYPKLFNSFELASTNFARFPKWTDMRARWRDGAPCESSTCTTKGWQEFLDNLRGQDRMTQIKEVNKAFNLKPYTIDIKNWGVADYWETPYQFLKKNGDCEDYAIAKFMALKALGVPKEDMRVVAVQDLNLGIGHAVLIVYDGDTPLLLDNQINAVIPASRIKHYKPVYSINEDKWWLHR